MQATAPGEELEIGFLEDVPSRVSPAKHFVVAAKFVK